MVALHAPDESPTSGALSAAFGMQRFHFAGSLLPTSAYIERPADRILPELLRRGTYCHVLAPRQIGKSSLRWRVTHELQAEGVRCASIDLTVCGSAVDPEQWYFTVAAEIADDLGLPDPQSFLDEHRHLTPPRRFSAYVKHVVKSDPERRRVVIFLDEIEAVRLVSFPVDDFLLAIRGLFEERSGDEELCRLAFCLIGVTTPNDLMKDRLVTPFNVSTQVHLDDFTREQISVLGPGLADLGGSVDALLDAVYDWTDGHPYMTMRTCAALVSLRAVGAGEEDAAVGRVVRAEFLDHPLEDGNIGYAARRFEDTRHEREGAPVGERITLYRRILEGERVPAEGESAVQMELRLAGMIKEVEEAGEQWLRTRNKIFATALGPEWLSGKVDQWVEAERRRIRSEVREVREELKRYAEYDAQARRGIGRAGKMLNLVGILASLNLVYGVVMVSIGARGFRSAGLLIANVSALGLFAFLFRLVRKRIGEANHRLQATSTEIEKAKEILARVDRGVAEPR
jgi:hypothetical protein